jgi:hypothetical protein
MSFEVTDENAAWVLSPTERAAVQSWLLAEGDEGYDAFHRLVWVVWEARRAEIDCVQFTPEVLAIADGLALPIPMSEDDIRAALNHVSVIVGFMAALHKWNHPRPLNAMDFFGLGFGVGRATTSSQSNEVIGRVAEVATGQATMLATEAEYRVGMAHAGEAAVAEMIYAVRDRRSMEGAAAAQILAELTR